MLSYRHGFHAGNFADVVKHVALVLLLQALHRKESPCFILDTHAGAGLYNLLSAEAQKNREYATGIAKIMTAQDIPQTVRDYLALVNHCNQGGKLHNYPGSPWLIQHLLRQQDYACFTELHNTEFGILKRHVGKTRHIAVQNLDGYHALKAVLPPKQARGLVFIDPPFETRKEFSQFADGLLLAAQRWRTGMVAGWYPLLAHKPAQSMLDTLVQSGQRKILQLELSLAPASVPGHMAGCGMIIINPPWHLDEELAAVLPWLCETLGTQGRGENFVEWLVAE